MLGKSRGITYKAHSSRLFLLWLWVGAVLLAVIGGCVRDWQLTPARSWLNGKGEAEIAGPLWGSSAG